MVTIVPRCAPVKLGSAPRPCDCPDGPECPLCGGSGRVVPAPASFAASPLFAELVAASGTTAAAILARLADQAPPAPECSLDFEDVAPTWEDSLWLSGRWVGSTGIKAFAAPAHLSGSDLAAWTAGEEEGWYAHQLARRAPATFAEAEEVDVDWSLA